MYRKLVRNPQPDRARARCYSTHVYIHTNTRRETQRQSGGGGLSCDERATPIEVVYTSLVEQAGCSDRSRTRSEHSSWPRVPTFTFVTLGRHTHGKRDHGASMGWRAWMLNRSRIDEWPRSFFLTSFIYLFFFFIYVFHDEFQSYRSQKSVVFDLLPG